MTNSRKEKKYTQQELKEEIKTWQQRADMSRQWGNDFLAGKALENKRKFENILAIVQEFE